MAVLGLRFCARAFSSCGKRGSLFTEVRRPLTIAASLAGEHRLQTRRLSSCGSWAQPLRGMWDPPRPGLEPASPALAADSQPLRHQRSPPGEFFIINRCWILSKAFSAPIEMIIWFLSFDLLIWCITRIDLCILKNPCIPGINPTWSWCTILLMCCCILFASILLRIFASMFISDIVL